MACEIFPAFGYWRTKLRTCAFTGSFTCFEGEKMQIEKKDLVEEFAKRTIANLNTVEKLAAARKPQEIKDHGPYEVTQLLNSCLGLLVFPHERLGWKIHSLPWVQFEQEGWPVPKSVKGDERKELVEDLSEMIRVMRNALTHCGLEFTRDKQDPNEIGGG